MIVCCVFDAVLHEMTVDELIRMVLHHGIEIHSFLPTRNKSKKNFVSLLQSITQVNMHVVVLDSYIINARLQPFFPVDILSPVNVLFLLAFYHLLLLFSLSQMEDQAYADSARCPYVVGNTIKIKLKTASQPEVTAKIIKIFEPFTLSCAMAVNLIDSTSLPYLKIPFQMTFLIKRHCYL